MILLIKINTFIKKIDSYFEKRSQDVLKDLNFNQIS